MALWHGGASRVLEDLSRYLALQPLYLPIYKHFIS